jgi:putative lipoic acid-binding regulatory protein
VPGQEQDPPRIEFPCDYPIKVMGRACEEFESSVVEIIERHAPGIDASRITVKNSSKGTFVSMTVFIVATGKSQLKALHGELMDSGLVQMVI